MCIILTYLLLKYSTPVVVFYSQLKTPLFKMTIKECCVTANVGSIKMIMVLGIVLLTIWTGNNVLAEQGEGWHIYHSKELARLLI